MAIANYALETSGPSGALLRIEAAAPQLTPTERRIAQRVLDDPGLVVLRSISQLAAELDVTQPSLSRFAKAVGFPGFRELRLSIARDIATAGTSAAAADVSDTHAHAAELARLAARCADATAVEVWSAPELQSAASDLAARIQRLGVPAAVELAPALWAARASGAAPGTLCLLLGGGADDRVWIAGTQLARDAGLDVAGLAHEAVPKASALSDALYFTRSTSALADAVALVGELDTAIRSATGAAVDPARSSRRSWRHVRTLGGRTTLLHHGDAQPRAVVALLSALRDDRRFDHAGRSLAHALLAHGLDVIEVPHRARELPAEAVAVVGPGIAGRGPRAVARTAPHVRAVAALPDPSDPGHGTVTFATRRDGRLEAAGEADEPELSYRNELVAQWLGARLHAERDEGR